MTQPPHDPNQPPPTHTRPPALQPGQYDQGQQHLQRQQWEAQQYAQQQGLHAQSPTPPNRDQFHAPMPYIGHPGGGQQVFQPGPYVIPPKKINHALHLVLSIFTAGLWVPVWICIAVFSQKKSRVVMPDGRTVKR